MVHYSSGYKTKNVNYDSGCNYSVNSSQEYKVGCTCFGMGCKRTCRKR